MPDDRCSTLDTKENFLDSYNVQRPFPLTKDISLFFALGMFNPDCAVPSNCAFRYDFLRLATDSTAQPGLKN